MKHVKTIIVCACIALAACGSCLADARSERAFMWNEANAIAASAREPEDYLAAARAYQELLDRGVRNGPVLYNMGTALLNAGDNANAAAVLLRAERYMGRNPELAHNLSIAFARAEKEKGSGSPWYRTALFWHFRLSAPSRTAVAALAFFMFWLFHAARALGGKRWTKYPIAICALIFIVFGTSVATSVHQESNAKRIVPVVAEKSLTALAQHLNMYANTYIRKE